MRRATIGWIVGVVGLVQFLGGTGLEAAERGRGRLDTAPREHVAPCDADGDGDVDLQDARAVMRFLALGISLLGDGDCDADGTVSRDDIEAIAENHGDTESERPIVRCSCTANCADLLEYENPGVGRTPEECRRSLWLWFPLNAYVKWACGGAFFGPFSTDCPGCCRLDESGLCLESCGP